MLRRFRVSLAAPLVLALGSSSLAAPQCSNGGPGGDFDWVIPAGTTLILDTNSDLIIGGPGGVPTVVQNVIGGVVEVRDLIVEPGALLLFQGPNPPTILASRNVQVDGWIRVDGLDALSLGSGGAFDLPAPGAPGQAGGGGGGTGSVLIGQSSPQGGNGLGAYGVPDGGGEGGETGFGIGSVDIRRGAGGGGGRFGADILVELEGVQLPGQNLIGMDAEAGFAGGPTGLGAVSQNRRARGGDIGPSPFQNGRPGDDFFGTMVTPVGTVIQGELPQVWAGSGGGGGGDAVASESFPMVPFSLSAQRRGAGGGAGAGSLILLADGDVSVGEDGRITAEGGMGAAGENTSFFNRVGGGSGGGSGGHIVLQAGGQLNFEAMDVPAGAGDFYDDVLAGMRQRPISARGGQGGAGQQSDGGANEDGTTAWRCDAIPYTAFVPGVVTPPLDNVCFRALSGVGPGLDLFDWDDPNNVAVAGAGGDGSPGVIQLHVSSTEDILVPAAAAGDLTKLFVPPPVGWSQGVFRGRLEPNLCSLLASWGGSRPLGFSAQERTAATTVRTVMALDAGDLLKVDFGPR